MRAGALRASVGVVGAQTLLRWVGVSTCAGWVGGAAAGGVACAWVGGWWAGWSAGGGGVDRRGGALPG